jgi:hypothetical protein
VRRSLWGLESRSRRVSVPSGADMMLESDGFLGGC